jgi:molecular chaperone DnaK (HSP70)
LRGVQALLTQTFSGKPPRHTVDPDLAVAMGAARVID